jgi:parallel beta-helix repeat protein
MASAIISRKRLSRNKLRSVRCAALALWCFATVGAIAADHPRSGSSREGKLLQYYVAPRGNDRWEGSSARPWATLQHAAEKAVAGVVINVAPGEYRGPVTTSKSGVPFARIRFVSEKQWGAVVRSSGSHAAWTNDGDFVDIVGFDISGDAAIGIFNRASNVRIIGNHVHHISVGGCDGNGGAGILNGNYSASDDDVINNVVHDIGEPNKSCARVHGIYHSNVRGRILNNISYNNEGYGIHLWHAANEVTIANNLVFNNRHGGIVVGAGDAPFQSSPMHPADRVLVVNNIVVYNQNRYGIEELGVTGPNNTYVNNLVYGNQFADWKLQAGRQLGTIAADPHFIAYRPDGSGDYHLSSVSPGIGKASINAAPFFDIEGYVRPQHGTWDVGPYQSGAIEKHDWPPESCLPDCDLEPLASKR